LSRSGSGFGDPLGDPSCQRQQRGALRIPAVSRSGQFKFKPAKTFDVNPSAEACSSAPFAGAVFSNSGMSLKQPGIGNAKRVDPL
jgi:hypothetical protein